MIAGGFADATLARPDSLAWPDLGLVIVGLSSLVAFFALNAVTWPRVIVTSLVAAASLALVAAATSEPLVGARVMIAIVDVAARVGFFVSLVVLLRRHPLRDPRRMAVGRRGRPQA